MIMHEINCICQKKERKDLFLIEICFFLSSIMNKKDLDIFTSSSMFSSKSNHFACVLNSFFV